MAQIFDSQGMIGYNQCMLLYYHKSAWNFRRMGMFTYVHTPSFFDIYICLVSFVVMSNMNPPVMMSNHVYI